jgi:hypothetical protein
MAYVSNNNNAQSTKELERAVSWINIYAIGADGKRHKIGAVPLNASKAVQMRVHSACESKGLESIIEHIQLEWQAGGSADPTKLDLPF